MKHWDNNTRYDKFKSKVEEIIKDIETKNERLFFSKIIVRLNLNIDIWKKQLATKTRGEEKISYLLAIKDKIKVQLLDELLKKDFVKGFDKLMILENTQDWEENTSANINIGGLSDKFNIKVKDMANYKITIEDKSV